MGNPFPGWEKGLHEGCIYVRVGWGINDGWAGWMEGGMVRRLYLIWLDVWG